MVDAESSKIDERLIDATIAGDEQAFAEITRRHKTRVFGLVSRFAKNPADMEDICQDIFIRAFLKLRQFRRDSPFEHWLLRIATWKCYDYLRKNRRTLVDLSMEVLLETGHEIEAPRHRVSPAVEQLHAALARLSVKERLVITLLELEDHSVQEVAELTGWSIANVKVRAFRARAALRKLIETTP
jgi:RNA polymerase sigma-70 factor (ECF subfamily)